MAANTGFPKPECLPYFYVTATSGALPDYLGYVDSSALTADAVWTLPQFSTPTRQMVVGAMFIFKNTSNFDLTITTVGDDLINNDTEYIVQGGHTVMVVVSPTEYNVFGDQNPGFRGDADGPNPDRVNSVRYSSRQEYLKARTTKSSSVPVSSATPQ